MWRIVVAGCVVISSLCRASFASSRIQNQIGAILQHSSLRSAKVAIRAELLETHEELFSLNAKAPMIPASNLKLLTAGCALLNLGPDFRFKTSVLGSGIQSAGELPGDLVLRGAGDPTWNKDFYTKPTIPLIALAQQLKASGLRTVDGDLVVDDSLFEREFIGKGWKARYQWEDYAAEVSAASLNRNEVMVSVLPGAYAGSPARISVSPLSHALTIVNRVLTTSRGSHVDLSRDREKNVMIVSGAINRYHPGMMFRFNIHNPPTLVASAFLEVLKTHGIAVKGTARVIRPAEMEKDAHLVSLAEIQSPTLLAIVQRLDKESDNFLAEHLFRALGARAFGHGSIGNGERAISGCLTSLGLTEAPLNLADGSGLSDQDRVSALTLVRLLEGMAALPVGAYFKNSLPRGGVDGTLEDRLKDVQVQAKTGAIRGVSSLSGYLVNHAGRTVVFSIIVNDFPGSSESARRLIDSIVRVLARGKEPA